MTSWRDRTTGEWVRVAGGADDPSRPPENTEILCYDAATGRYFVGNWCADIHPRSGAECWCDEECTYVTVTHWAKLLERPE